MKRLIYSFIAGLLTTFFVFPQNNQSSKSIIKQVSIRPIIISGKTTKASKESNKIEPVLRYIQEKASNLNLSNNRNLEQFIKTNQILPMTKTLDNLIIIPVLIKSQNTSLTENLIRENGGNVSTIAGNILVAEIALSSISKIVNNKETIFIESSKYYQTCLDISHTEIKADKVHTGFQLPGSYRGKEVIVGIVDSGIDWKHENFVDEEGSRILYIWDMSENLNYPLNYDYGTEYTKSEIDSNLCQEIDSHGHGTHVASIAAGNDNSLYGYTGIAPKADIICVKTEIEGSIYDNNVIDGCNYIFSKAEDLGKPAVINISLGHNSGPHDGTSLSDQAYSNLTGPGKIIVTSAGNSGSNFHHLSYETNGIDYNSSYKTFLSIPDTAIFVFIDMWYDTGNISVGIAAFDSSYQLIGYTEPVSPGEKIFSVPFRFNEQNYAYVTVDATTTNNPNNNSKNVSVNISRSQLPLDTVIWALYTFGTGKFDAWIWGTFGTFSSLSDLDNRIMPADNIRTIGEPGTAKQVICVGSYVTKNEWIDIDGNVQNQFLPDNNLPVYGDISFFSSIGPTRDNRLKPDLVAPGEVIIAALSSNMEDVPRKNILLGGKHLRLRGTSMACPHVTGTVALMLESAPHLSYSDIYDLLIYSSRKDSFTGLQANNIFGHGKIDALQAIQDIIATDVKINHDSVPQRFTLMQNYPNPFNISTTIKYNIPPFANNHNKSINVILRIYDVLGNKIDTLIKKKQSSGNYSTRYYASNLSSGIYFYKINAGSFSEARKMIVLK